MQKLSDSKLISLFQLNNSQVELLKINFYSDNQNVDLVSSPCKSEIVDDDNFDGRDCQE